MEMECEKIAVESRPPIAPCETVNGNHETVENGKENETCETHQAQSNSLAPAEDSSNLTDTRTCLEFNVTLNETDLTSSQSQV